MGLDATIKWDAELATRTEVTERDSIAITETELNELKQQRPEIVDIYLPATANNQFAVVTMKKRPSWSIASLDGIPVGLLCSAHG